MSEQPLEIRTYESLASLDILRTEWEELLSEVPTATVFSTWEWLVPWWRAFAGDQQLAVLGFFDSTQRLVGLAPISLSTHRVVGGVKLNVVRMMGDGSQDSDNLDMPVRSGYEAEVSSALLAWLKRHARHWDYCSLNTLPSHSRAGNQILKDLKARGWAVFRTTRSWSVIELPESWESYLKMLSGKERGKIGIRTRRLEKHYQVRIYRCADSSELQACLEALFDLHGKHWQARGRPGSFQSAARRQFYRELAELLLARGWLQFWLLELDGKIVASQIGFRYGDTVFSLQEGFDPDYSSESAGYVLRSQAIKQLIAEGVRRYDFLGGTDDSKARWGAQVDRYMNLDFARPLTLGSAYLTLKHRGAQVKQWLRMRLSPRAWQALRAAGARVRRS